MRINHNIPALRTLFQLSKTNGSLDKTMERLSSGLRINSAADDAAGLAITQKMDTQIRGLNQAKRNAMDGISMIQTGEGALSEVHEMLQRIRELSVQASNGTYDASDRVAIQDEVDELKNEIQRISEDIEFNERKLLNGDLDRRAFPDDETIVQIVSLTDTVSPGSYTVDITTDAEKAIYEGGASAYAGATINATNAGTININGEEVDIEVGDTASDVFNKLRSVAETIGADLVAYGDSAGSVDYTSPSSFTFGSNMHLVFEHQEYGSDFSLSINASNSTLLTNLGLSAGGGGTYTPGTDVVATIDTTSDFNTTATVATEGNIITVTDKNGFEMKFEAQDGAAGNSSTVKVLDAGPLDLQIGANEGQFMEVRIQNLSPKALEIENINLSTTDGAQVAIEAVDVAINMISSVRSKLGAYQNRLEHTIGNLASATENMTSSLSRILDADMAEEMAEYTQRNIISQSGVSMLAQANQRPQQILQLLQG